MIYNLNAGILDDLILTLLGLTDGCFECLICIANRMVKMICKSAEIFLLRKSENILFGKALPVNQSGSFRIYKANSMKTFLHSLLSMAIITCILTGSSYAQTQKQQNILRIYEDNDYLNIRGKGTDKAYTAGTRVDVFYRLKRRPRLFGIFRALGDSSIYEGEWGLMQALYTPNNIRNTCFQPGDYLYSGALYAIHSVHACYPIEKNAFNIEYRVGIRGPYAFGKQTQTFIHKLIHYQVPEGWNNQLSNSPVLNVNIAFEKQLASKGKLLEVIGGGRMNVGTLENSFSIYPLVRFGLMTSYFNGYMSQFISHRHGEGKSRPKIQAYLVAKPQIQMTISNSMLEGGLFAKPPSVKLTDGTSQTIPSKDEYSVKSIRKLVYSVSYGFVVSTGGFAFSFTQNCETESKKGTYSHEVGNISLYITL